MQSLAVKYRPQSFADVVGQQSVIAILQNQLATNDTKQGYLMTGGAGTGKTTIARIFAKAINGGKGEPIEIDAASNNGVDSVRDIRESCKFKPLDSQHKVYIIDEVHMLSTGAFNALLKTLEEPPAHAVFILCTTDPQKIPATILSRVQRFDFKRMTVEQTVNRLRYIADAEGIALSNVAAEYIAKLAEGGMRNAISLLDTVAGYSRDIDIETVLNVLGRSSVEKYIDLTVFIRDSQRDGIIDVVEQVHNDGMDLRVFIKGFIEFIVDLEKIALGVGEYASIPANYTKSAESISQVGIPTLANWFSKTTTLYNYIRYDASAKALIEGALINLCQ